jgi:hypothetical protein
MQDKEKQEVILEEARVCAGKATLLLLRIDHAVCIYDHSEAQRQIGNLQEELSTLVSLLNAMEVK